MVRRVSVVRNGAAPVSTPLYRLKAEFFKTLGHPVRIRVLELLSERDHAVSEMLPEVGVEAAHLSQQLAVLRRAGLVTARREGSAVHYTLADPGVAELLRVARTILTGCWRDRRSCWRICGRAVTARTRCVRAVGALRRGQP